MNKKKKGFVIPEEKGIKKEKTKNIFCYYGQNGWGAKFYLWQ